MTQSDRYTIEELERRTRNAVNQLITAINSSKEAYDDFKEFQSGRINQPVAQDLFELVKVRNATLSIVAATGVITCKTNYDLFAGLSIGDPIAMTGWVAAGNNADKEISAKGTDSITVSDITGLVNATDDAGVTIKVKAEVWQTDIVQDYDDAYDAVLVAWNSLNNVAVTTADRMDTLRRVV